MTSKIDDSIDRFMKDILMKLTSSVRSSFDLPDRGTSEDNIFNEFPQYKKVVNGLSLKILNNIQFLIDKQDGKGNVLDTGEKKGLEDKFNILVEVNDRLLDKCNNLISAIENPVTNKSAPIVVVEYSADKKVQDGCKMTPRQTIQLLSSKQVERPQCKFSRPPDNSKSPFRPLITKKPNALRPLGLTNGHDDDTYPHPYEWELEHLEISEQYKKVNEAPIIPGSLDETPYEYIDTIDGLEKMIGNLKNVNEIAVDVEHHNVRTYLGLTCLLQISTRFSDYVIDTLALHGNLESLNEVFTNPKIIKIFHGANSDVMWLQRDLGVYIVNMFDTGYACTSLNFPRKSLSYLLERYCQVHAKKEYQRLTDWRIRPLIPELIEYARTDTHYLLYIYDRLKQELSAVDLIGEVFHASKKLCQLVYQKPISSEDDCMDLYRKSNESFNPRQLYALRRLWELRDNIAREEDESAPFVLPNRILLSMAQVLPRETSGVLACCSQDWKLPLLRKYVYDFQKICLEAYNESMAKEVKHTIKRSNILDLLLSKHDRMETEEVEVKLDESEIRECMKVPEVVFQKARETRIPAMVGKDEAVVRSFLACHPITVIELKEEEIKHDKNDVKEIDETIYETMDDDSMDVVVTNIEEVAEVTGVQVCDQEPEAVTSQPIREKKVKTPKVAQVPFDFEAQLKQLKNESKTDNKAKSFNPLVTKKFKRNQKGKKHT